ncbi:MAG: DUF86 domain-containing protein [Candidatus Omnitrophota bacterium]
MRDYKLYLDDIVIAIKKIEKYSRNLSLQRLKKESLIIDGIARNLEIIGEAAKNIPHTVKENYPDIEWKKIAGLRDILAHEYFGIDIDVLWDIVKNKLPDLKKKVYHILR